jgi:hypothetical protein
MCGFSTTLTTTAHSPQQLVAVWHLHLHADTEGPTFISTTARRPNGFVFYIEILSIVFRTHQCRCGILLRYSQEGACLSHGVPDPEEGDAGYCKVQRIIL